MRVFNLSSKLLKMSFGDDRLDLEVMKMYCVFKYKGKEV